MRTAIVNNVSTQVVNLVDWPGGAWPGAGQTAIQIAEDSPVATGWTWDGTDFRNAGQIDPTEVASRIRFGLAAALPELRAIVTRGTTFLAQANYTVTSSAQAQTAINDLLAKLKNIVGGVPADGTGGLMAIARDVARAAHAISNLLDTTT